MLHVAHRLALAVLVRPTRVAGLCWSSFLTSWTQGKDDEFELPSTMEAFLALMKETT